MATKNSTQTLTPTASSSAAATGLAVVPRSTAPRSTAPRSTAPRSTILKTAAPKTAAPKRTVLPKVMPKEKAVTTSSKVPPKAKAKAAAKPELVLSLEMLHDEIRRESYDYYIQRGYRPGDPKADWLRAEDAVLRRHGLR